MCPSYSRLLAEVTDDEFHHQVCIAQVDGIFRASVPPCVEGEQLVNAELSGLAVLAAQVLDSELPPSDTYNLAQTGGRSRNALAQRSANLVEANINTLF